MVGPGGDHQQPGPPGLAPTVPVVARRVDRLDVEVHADGAAMARAAADHAARAIRAAVEERGVAHAMFATGNSQLDFVEALTTATPDVPWSETVVFHMDEYVGIGPDHPAGFQRWIRERIVDRVHPRSAFYVDGLSDPDRSCRHYAALLAAHPLDLCCLGIGENGHLAFNDPPVADFDDPLDVKEVSSGRGQPYPAGQRGPLRRPRPGPHPGHHRDHPRTAASADGDGRSARASQGRAGAGLALRARCRRPARRRRCGPRRGPRCSSSRTRRPSSGGAER